MDGSQPLHQPQTSPDHELSGMESFLDNLFNQHMVLPQPPEDARSSESVDGRDPAREDLRTDRA